jgi:predicted enzyme related to lactoylglutathione lyase
MTCSDAMHSTILNITFDCTDAKAQAISTVPEPKRAKNRVHLDLLPPGDDQQAELARLVRLGATIVAAQPPGVSWIILADPEGNEFCLEG